MPDTTLEGVCVVMATYNNAATLGSVIDGVLISELPLIVVNDGSTDSTVDVLKPYLDRIDVRSFTKNTGKGAALREGFKRAIARGFRYAITIDSDGQHKPEELPKFLQCIEENPDSLLLGARDLTSEGAPARSSFGNRFSNFWTWVETGLKLPDTQTGYRCYPLVYVQNMTFFTRKFEFEIEAIVRLVWRGVEVHSIPVRAVYDDDRISHFRPFTDFMRISVVNTVLVTIALIWYHPVRLLRYVTAKGFWNVVWQDLIDPTEPPIRKSAAVGFGLFMGIFPVWGFQMLIAVAVSIPLKLNKFVVLAFANISIPPLIPFIIYCSYLMGRLLVKNPQSLKNWQDLSLESIWLNFSQYLLGAILLAAITGITGFLISYAILTAWPKRRK